MCAAVAVVEPDDGLVPRKRGLDIALQWTNENTRHGNARRVWESKGTGLPAAWYWT